MIKVSGLHKTYPVQHGDVHEIRAVNGISFDIPTGSFFSLLGPSGCGKSTTLRCVAGLERPEAGEIIIGDQVVFSSEKQRVPSRCAHDRFSAPLAILEILP